MNKKLRDRLIIGGMVAFVAAVIGWAIVSPDFARTVGLEDPIPTADRPESLTPMCKPIVAMGVQLAPQIAIAQWPDETPSIVKSGPPIRVQCPTMVRERTGNIGAVSADIHCFDPRDPKCFTVLAVMSDRGETYIPASATKDAVYLPAAR